MRRRIPTSSPFRDIPRFAFGYEWIESGMRVLDYGCSDGWFGAELLKHKPVEYVGVDKDGDLLKKESPVRIVIVKDSLPFEAETFDVATAFEVLEHVYDQDRLLRELWRVLRPNGLLIVSVPRKNVFSFLDMGNWKYVFPRAHRIFYTMTHSAEDYRYRYVDNPYGMVGLMEKEKRWHQHFRDREMQALLERNGYETVESDGAGLLSSVFDVLSQAPPMRPLFTQKLRNWDSYAFHQRSLVCAARKIVGSRP
jgi:SAM-dependent methyltransferase